MPVISDRQPVIALAKTIARTKAGLTRQSSASRALRQYFRLADCDGIWGDSEAAACMGFMGRSPEEDLFDEIAADVAASIR